MVLYYSSSCTSTVCKRYCVHEYNNTPSMNSDRGLTYIRAVPGLYSRAYSHGVEYIPGVLEYIPGGRTSSY